LIERCKAAKPLAFYLKKSDGTQWPDTEPALPFLSRGSPIEGLPSAQPFQNQSEDLGQEKWSIEVMESDIQQKLDPSLQKTVKINGQDHFCLNPDAFDDFWIVCQYSANDKTKSQ